MKRTWENYTRIYMYSENQNNYLQSVRRSEAISVHLVCLGNICRSPIANALLANKCADLTKPKVAVDSSGTGPWHVGEDALLSQFKFGKRLDISINIKQNSLRKLFLSSMT